MAKVKKENVSAQELKGFADRVERLYEDRDAVNDDVKTVLAEAKATGFDAGAIRKIVSRRRKNKEKLKQEEGILDTYLSILKEE